LLDLHIEHCLQHEVDELTAALEDSGALSISIMSQQDNPILEPAPGETPLWDQLAIQALYENSQQADAAQNWLDKNYPHLRHALNEVPEQDWERVCLDRFTPQRFGQRLWVCPSWHKPPEPNAVNLTLDPGLAFGTGTHPTTSLCLTWLEQTNLDSKGIIDYGCGSGILGLAALKLGARHAHAVDIDDQALLATQQNASINQISPNVLSISHPDSLDKPVDLLIANILLSPLLTLKNTFYQLLKPKGLLVVSGLFTEQAQTLTDAYQTHFTHQSTLEEEEWALVTFQRTSPN
jgi:ribosomal protein L11 methyltransferase